MSKAKREKKVRTVSVGTGILVFVAAFIGGVVSKFAITPSWAKNYSVERSEASGKSA